MQKIQQKIAG